MELTPENKAMILNTRIEDTAQQIYVATLDKEAEEAADTATGESEIIGGRIQALADQIARLEAKKVYYQSELADLQAATPS